MATNFVTATYYYVELGNTVYNYVISPVLDSVHGNMGMDNVRLCDEV